MEKIKKSFKGVVSYFSLCIKYTFQNFFKKANAVFGSIFVTLFFLFSQHYHWFSDSDFENSLSGIILGFFLMIVARLLFAPYYIWNEDQDSINELSKIDKSDLENMLGGRFIFQNTFLYGGDINICKRYDGKDKIMSLNNIYTAIKVMAPKNSLAQITGVQL